ncbi:MAG: hypothetical protein ACOYBY_06040 [Dermatophilaceae bacterium]
MTPAWAGDPASCSRLGGALRTTAARLAEQADTLDPRGTQGRLLQQLLPQLDDVGSRLQLHAQEVAELVVSARRLAERAEAAGLVLEELRVREPLGVVDVRDAERRLRARAPLQAQADRIAARLGRSRAELTRQLHAASEALHQLRSGVPGRRGPGAHLVD